jgi:hypothetical protein
MSTRRLHRQCLLGLEVNLGLLSPSPEQGDRRWTDRHCGAIESS